MTLQNFTDNTALPASALNAYLADIFGMLGARHVQALIANAAPSYSANYQDLWGEAYTAAIGKNSSVGTLTNACWASIQSKMLNLNFTSGVSGDTTYDPNSMTNASYFFDGNDATAATRSAGVATLGKTFAAKLIGIIRIKAQVSGGTTSSLNLQSYNGSVWTTEVVLATSSGGTASYDSYYQLNKTVQGIAINTSGNGTSGFTNTFYTLDYGTGDATAGTIAHTIPTGTFSSGITKAIFFADIADWEIGADIQFQLSNGSGDSTGYLAYGGTPQVVTFTAFAAAPTILTVKLIPKGSSPTAGYPSVRGICIRATP